MNHPFSKNIYTLQKPGRYIGKEFNSIVKGINKKTFRIALLYPETYEIGMSNLGVKIIYHIFNSIEGFYAERAFLPWTDAIDLMKKEKIPLFTLETYTPLNKMDLIGFSLHTELNYTNVLLALELAHIPLKRADRTEKHPLIITGGPASMNPAPIEAFFDFFIVGEGEDIIREIAPILKAYKSKSLSKDSLLKALSDFKGVYVPAYPKSTEKGTVFSLKNADYPSKQIVPNVDIVHKRLVVEIMRGCTRGCRFCQGGFTYRPLRIRHAQDTIKIIENGVKNTGYTDVSLLAFTTSDYPELSELLFNIKNTLPGVSVSLPSLPTDALTEELFRLLNSMKKFNITLAPETVSQKLRAVINKNVELSTIENTIKLAEKYNYNHIKLYFMLGLPFEEWSDVKEIPQFLRELTKFSHKITFHAKFSPFVPRPHTPFEDIEQENPQEIMEKIKYLKDALRRVKRIRMSYHNPYQSYLEGILGRGDNAASTLIVKAFKLGAFFDERSEFFNYNKYLMAARAMGKELEEFSFKPAISKKPWKIIDTGIFNRFLEREFKKAKELKYTQNCEYSGCKGCGVWIKDYELCKALPIKIQTSKYIGTIGEEAELQHLNTYEYILVYSKKGPFKYIGHNETIESLLFGLNRSNIHIKRKKGFKKRLMISMKNATPFGIASEGELLYMKTYEPISNSIDRINKNLPEGLKVLKILAGTKKDLAKFTEYYEVKPAPSVINPQKHCIYRENTLIIYPDSTKGIFKILNELTGLDKKELYEYNITKKLLDSSSI